jgi:hypothetical protein
MESLKKYLTKKNIAIVSLVIIIAVYIIWRYFNPSLKYYRILETKLPQKIVTTKISDIENVTSVNDGFVTTKDGQLHAWRSPKDHEQLLNLKISDNAFTDDGSEMGLMGVAKIGNKIYLCYTTFIPTSMLDRPMYFLTINEYSENMEFVRNIDSIELPTDIHHAGTLQSLDDKLVVSIGDGGPQGDPKGNAQNLRSKLGKILIYNLGEKPKSKVLVYGLRNPWKFWISPENVIYIGDVGYNTSEAVYRIELNLSQMKPVNCGWPNYEGSYRRKRILKNVENPFFEYPTGLSTGRCVIGGFLVDNMYLLGDYVTGTIRLLNESGEEILKQDTDHKILSFGMMKNENGAVGPVICAKDGVYWLSFESTN